MYLIQWKFCIEVPQKTKCSTTVWSSNPTLGHISWQNLFFLFFFSFLDQHLCYIDVHRLGVELELQLLAYAIATAIAMPYPSNFCYPSHSLQQCWILNLLNKARDQIHVLKNTSPVLNPLSHNGNSNPCLIFKQIYILKPSISI